jgi:hypothetical protein
VADDSYQARVISLPVERTTSSARRAAASATAPIAGIGSWHVDDWGRDQTLVGLSLHLGRLRWSITVGGAGRLPARRGALIVVNARRYALIPIVTALALGDATERAVRFVGRPDVAPFGPLLRRLGGLLDRPDEVAGALRCGEIVVMGATPELHPRRVGRVDHRLIGAAVEAGATVFPTATLTSPLSRHGRIEIGSAARPGRRRRGPLSELELADVTERRIQRLLDELGGAQTGTLLDWLPIGGPGGS